jgi:signal transduction histidine kinase
MAYSARMTTEFAALAIGMALGVSAAGWLANRRAAAITRAVTRAVTRAARAVAAGDLSARASLPGTGAAAELPAAFDQMLEVLAQRQAELERANAELRRGGQQLEQRIAARTRELGTLLEVSRTVTSTLALKPLLAMILDQLQKVVDFRLAALLVVEGDELVLLEERGGWGTPGERTSLAAHPNTREMLRQGTRPYIVPDLAADTPLAHRLRANLQALRADAPDRSMASWMSVPLAARDGVLGAMVLMHADAGYYSDERGELALAFAAQAAVMIANARLYEQAHRSATLEERHRVARELHDSVTQLIYSLGLFAAAGQEVAARGQAEHTERHLALIAETARQALKEVRLLVYELRPPVLEEEGLVGALRLRLEAVEQRSGVEARLVVDSLVSLPPPIEESLFRIALEALNNALRHAAATAVTVHLWAADGGVALEVSDNGRGFDPARASGGLGLTSMRERAERLGGRVTLSGAPEGGTCLRASFPLPWGEQTRPSPAAMEGVL